MDEEKFKKEFEKFYPGAKLKLRPEEKARRDAKGKLMTDDNRARSDILFKALSDASIVYSKSNYPNLKKDDYEALKHLYNNIEISVESSIEFNHPNVDIKDIHPNIVFLTFLKQEHNIDLDMSELQIILEKIKPKHKIKTDNKEQTKIIENFYRKIDRYKEDFIESSSSKFKKILTNVYKELQEIKNLDLKYYKDNTDYNYYKKLKKIPDGYERYFRKTGVFTKKNTYCFELELEHKEFIGLETFLYHKILSQEDLVKELSKKTEENYFLTEVPELKDSKKIDLITKNDPDYFNKINQTKNKLKKIYENDHLYLDYKNINSKGSKSFYNMNNYVWYAFFSQAEKREIFVEKTDGKKVWKEKDFELVNPKTVFWKGSIERILAELPDVIENVPDYIEIKSNK